MTATYFDIGGIIVRLTAAPGTVELSGGLQRFCCEDRPSDHCIHLELVDRLPIPTGQCLFSDPERRVYRQQDTIVSIIGSPEDPYLRLDRRGTDTLARARRSAFSGTVRGKTVLQAMEAEHLVARSGGLLLHAAVIAHQGRAIAFTALSGVGKSTQAELWHRYRGAQIINGDRCILRPEGLAMGIPFSGSSGICGPARLPLAAVVLLSQAPTTTITPLRGIKAFRGVWEGCSVHTWNREDVERSTDSLTALLNRVPVYHLACTPDENAVLALEAELRK